MLSRLEQFLLQENSPSQAQNEAVGGRVLRPYQVEAFEKWAGRGCRGVVIAPTGTGKTIIGLHAIKRIGLPTLVITPYERVMVEWVKKGREADVLFTRFYGGEKRLSRYTVAIYNSVCRHPEILNHFELIILDEIHHVGADVFSTILPKIDGKKVLGLTATLKREDGKHYNILSKLPVVYTLDLKNAVENGYVAPITLVPIPAEMNREERKRYMEIQAEIWKVRSMLSFLKNSKAFQRDAEELERRLKVLINERRIFLSRIASKKDALYNVVTQHPHEKIIVFSESIHSIEELKTYLSEKGVAAETYHSDKSMSERGRIFSEWGKSFNVLLAVRALDEGVDVPEVAIAAIIASGQSVRQLVQRKGRIMRPREGKQARLYVIYANGTVETKLIHKIKCILKGFIKLY
ncbi:MAG: DEAD/DEAH box helicase [Candidatus Caldarchaeum sp.]|uniref:DEAD/DEAH box helicase n=1 Tax=Caldiarchaeum subterraneum TaxID=311458 RepID=A0A7J3G548_CALS0